MKRFGQVLGLKSEHLAEYRRHHADIWPEIAAALRAAGIRNYSIFHHEGRLFAYFEYVGPETEFAERMRALKSAPRMQAWLDLMEPMQVPFSSRESHEWWSTMEEVFHLD
jgi:L-rhamnose mutarotase